MVLLDLSRISMNGARHSHGDLALVKLLIVDAPARRLFFLDVQENKNDRLA